MNWSKGRYPVDVLSEAAQPVKPKPRDIVLERDQILEVDRDDFVGAVVGWENGWVVLEDRRGNQRSFPLSDLFHMEGQAVRIHLPRKQGGLAPVRTASGSRVADPAPARVALPSRIYVEGRHDAQLVEKIWGDDLRYVGVAVEYLGGIDSLVDVVAEFAPQPGRRLGVLVDHLVSRSKEQRIAADIAKMGYGDAVLIAGHRFIDIWQVIRPEVIGFKAWPQVPRDVDFKLGTLAALGIPHHDQADIARAWQLFLSKVHTFKDLDRDFVREMEILIDFVTQDGYEAATD
jgi:hypothetical protein